MNTAGKPDLESLSEWLLGELHAGPGLLKRVERVVASQNDAGGPTYRTGSVIPTGKAAPKTRGDDSGISEECFALAVGLIEWQGRGLSTSTSQTSQDLLKYLMKNHLTDIDYLCGPGGLIAKVRQAASDEFRRELPDVDRLEKLGAFLTGWLESECNHRFTEQPSEDPRSTVYRCECGAGYYTYGTQQAWLAV